MNKKIFGLKVKLGDKLAHSQSPGDYFEAWCIIYNFSTIQGQSEYSPVDIVLINILIDLFNANVVLIVKEHAVTSSLEHFPLAIWSWVEDLLNNKLPTGNRLAKAQYVLISVSKFCNIIISLWVEQRHFSAFYKVLTNDFVKFLLFSVSVHSYLLRYMGLALATLDRSKIFSMGNFDWVEHAKLRLYAMYDSEHH